MDKEQKQMLVDALKRYHDCAFTPGVYEHSIVGQVALVLEKSEEVVRCKDCKWRQQDDVNRNFCGLGDFYCGDTDYCSRAERKDNG